ncbi:MAG: hypothetical protein DMG65_00125 [Candidatus Angelobacter sp. Gp1-AA117]|nr:MAG: hypothetical protein DMG65_00125 [Candidatus Angelobacter sp. Gp1-AA117]
MNRNTEQMELSLFTASHLLFRLRFCVPVQKWNKRLLPQRGRPQSNGKTFATQRNRVSRGNKNQNLDHGDTEKNDKNFVEVIRYLPSADGKVSSANT